MNENENLVKEVTEKVEQTTEEIAPEKKYTEDELNAKVDEILGIRLARKEAKIRKEYDRKYGDLVETLKAGTGKESVEDLNDTFTKFYEGKGIKINKPNYSPKDIEVLARAEANDIINSGYDEVVEEVDRLTEIGVENMTDRDKAMFKILAEHRQSTERSRELAEIGITEEVYNSQEFKDFANKFSSKTPIKDIYDIYNKTKPKKEIRAMGSMKNTDSADSGVKDFYTREEALRFTKKDFDKNPALYKAVEASMLKW